MLPPSIRRQLQIQPITTTRNIMIPQQPATPHHLLPTIPYMQHILRTPLTPFYGEIREGEEHLLVWFGGYVAVAVEVLAVVGGIAVAYNVSGAKGLAG